MNGRLYSSSFAAYIGQFLALMNKVVVRQAMNSLLNVAQQYLREHPNPPSLREGREKFFPDDWLEDNFWSGGMDPISMHAEAAAERASWFAPLHIEVVSPLAPPDMYVR